jgi:hypothetical protein
MMMKTMLRSRSLQMNFPQGFVVMDDKGGEGVEIKASISVSA